jgi:hypothetical protein
MLPLRPPPSFQPAPSLGVLPTKTSATSGLVGRLTGMVLCSAREGTEQTRTQALLDRSRSNKYRGYAGHSLWAWLVKGQIIEWQRKAWQKIKSKIKKDNS